MEPKGQFLNIDLDDTVFVPVSEAMSLLNRDDLLEIDVLYYNASETQNVVDAIKRVMLDRHDGEEDFTITSQESMLQTLDRISGVVTAAVGAIGGISLVVAPSAS
jgi:putative ABC transport system permease protein